MKCEICGKDQNEDLFSAVTGDPVCSICRLRFIGGLPTSPKLIADARARLCLKDGEYLKLDHSAEARNILGI